MSEHADWCIGGDKGPCNCINVSIDPKGRNFRLRKPNRVLEDYDYRFDTAKKLADWFLDGGATRTAMYINEEDLMRNIGNGQQVVKITVEYAPISEVMSEKIRLS